MGSRQNVLIGRKKWFKEILIQPLETFPLFSLDSAEVMLSLFRFVCTLVTRKRKAVLSLFTIPSGWWPLDSLSCFCKLYFFHILIQNTDLCCYLKWDINWLVGILRFEMGLKKFIIEDVRCLVNRIKIDFIFIHTKK